MKKANQNSQLSKALKALNEIISKSRVHLYKPIQIAEILHRHRTTDEVDLGDLSTYRTKSKKWRDIISMELVGRVSTSSSRYQDNLFDANAMPVSLLSTLGEYNDKTNGGVEAYIYSRFVEKYKHLNSALFYVESHTKKDFQLSEFLEIFWADKGLRRSIDKVYEVIVYALFSALIDALGVKVTISIDSSHKDILSYFEDFASSVVGLTSAEQTVSLLAKVHRVGVTNAADRGLDMWADFGMAIQIKHLSLTEELAENIVNSISSDRIVVVCKDAEEKIIISLLTQIGWKSRIQSIITEKKLIQWYDKALRGEYHSLIGDNVLSIIKDELSIEFPSTEKEKLNKFICERGYSQELYQSLI